MKWIIISIIAIVVVEVWALWNLAKPSKTPTPFVPDPEHMRRIREEYLSRRRQTHTDPRD